MNPCRWKRRCLLTQAASPFASRPGQFGFGGKGGEGWGVFLGTFWVFAVLKKPSARCQATGVNAFLGYAATLFKEQPGQGLRSKLPRPFEAEPEGLEFLEECLIESLEDHDQEIRIQGWLFFAELAMCC